MASFINENFVALHAHIKEHPAYFHRFDAVWTPTLLIMDSDGTERLRIEGYLPKEEFRAHLEMGLSRIVFMRKRWEEAERGYTQIIENYPETTVAPEAIYWKGICQYKRTNDHNVLGEVPKQLNVKYPDSVWALKASVCSH